MENKIPVDVHTFTKNLKLDPVLVTYFCCQMCYSLYNIKTSLLTCLTILTNRFPTGQLVRARLGTLLGNVMATHKVVGFCSHSATKPCSWCHVSNTKLSAMRIGICATKWRLESARAWCNSNHADCKKLVKKYPVNQVVLGVMHHWFEEMEESKYYTTEDNAMDKGGISSTFWSNTKKNKLINAVLEMVVLTGVTQMPRGFWRSRQSHDCNIFENAYKIYTDTSVWLFPDLKLLPNHHYTLHIPQKLRFWGLLMAVPKKNANPSNSQLCYESVKW
ncbi:hypothetical protein VP01_1540g2 [Puccinia sorghi]|uniref:Uncharacterized protein n=1 Tax=Puccinia sorghi TaxID=27349 RepID=A0A0L6VII3_9BASI|nr:hypothetical protein VP01_1540g2 [Puccinia sorghi]